ncbi:hypothetical protein [Sinorhizobium sp. BJ1]|uniref:hypothetical protein n=1 Tax=Sinorhizobium sp. BJ1 TaxID=2035455 RepID=UPI0015CF61B6|nr:hypothetical protein [Sinorhizobium sp. BJ1]
MIDALRDDVASGVPVVDVWQRFEVSGFIARALARAASYGDLYRILRDNGMPIGFRPTDVARWAAEGKISKAEVGEIFGLQDSEIDPFIRCMDFCRRKLAPAGSRNNMSVPEGDIMGRQRRSQRNVGTLEQIA